MTSAMSIPYSIDDARLIYCNSSVPTTSAGFFPNVTHWMEGNAVMADYESFPGEHQHPHIQHNPGHMIDGEIPVVIMDQMQQVQSHLEPIDQMQQVQGHLEPEMNPPLSFYPEMSIIPTDMAPPTVCHQFQQSPKAKSKHLISTF